MASRHYDPALPVDASLGLIFRLNQLWKEVDDLAFKGYFNEWNFKLDRIFSNLLYKNRMESVEDESGEVISVELADSDKKLYEFINKDVVEANKKIKKARTKEDLSLAKSEMYQALLKKEYALRKFMFQQKLYLKQTDSNPSRALWGG